MRALAAVLLGAAALAAAAAPAAAGFRYVPPAADAAAAGPAGKGPSREVPAEADGNGADPGPAVWRVRAGETLREALARWGARAGVEVLVLTDRRYRLDAGAAFEGGFADAAAALLAGLSHLPHPPEGAFAPDGAALVVTHRMRIRDDGRNEP